jgi:Flp pilus assembly pilin Flp
MSLKEKAKSIWNDESAQGATEYILILVAVVVVAFIFKGQIETFIRDRLSNLGQGLGRFDANAS